VEVKLLRFLPFALDKGELHAHSSPTLGKEPQIPIKTVAKWCP